MILDRCERSRRNRRMGNEIGSEKYLEKNGVKLKTVYASNRSEWVEDSVS